MSAGKILGIIILVLAFTMPQSGVYADTATAKADSPTAKLIKKIAEKDPLFKGFDYSLNHLCAAEKQAILEFEDSGESAAVEKNFTRQATICLEKLEEYFLWHGFNSKDDWTSGNKAVRHYKNYYCQEKDTSFVMTADSDFQSQLKMMYGRNCRRTISFISSADSCSARLRNHFNSIVEVKTVLGGLELAEITENAKFLYGGISRERLQRKHNEKEYEVISQCSQFSERSRYGFDNLALLFEFRKENRGAYHGYVQEYLNANCDAGKSCRKDPEMAKNLWRDNLHFYGPIGQKDLEIFATSEQASRGDDRILSAARAAIAELEATRKADIDRICAEYTFENPEVFCDKFGKE